MAQIVDPFSCAMVEVSEEFICSFPVAFQILPFLHKLFHKLGVEILSSEKPTSVRSSWLTMMKIEVFLRNLFNALQIAMAQNSILSETVLASLFKEHFYLEGSEKPFCFDGHEIVTEYEQEITSSPDLNIHLYEENCSKNFNEPIQEKYESKWKHKHDFQNNHDRNWNEGCFPNVNKRAAENKNKVYNKSKEAGGIMTKPKSNEGVTLLIKPNDCDSQASDFQHAALPEPIVVISEHLSDSETPQTDEPSKSEVEAALKEVLGTGQTKRNSCDSEPNSIINSMPQQNGKCKKTKNKRKSQRLPVINILESESIAKTNLKRKHPLTLKLKLRKRAKNIGSANKVKESVTFSCQSKGKLSSSRRTSARKTQNKVKSMHFDIKRAENTPRLVTEGEENEYTPTDVEQSDNKLTHLCDKCPSESAKASNLQGHQRRVHCKKGFQCTVCGKEFGQKGDLNRHMKSHEEPEHGCTFCGKFYKSGRRLKEHMETHGEDYVKPEYTCKFCDKSFSTKYVLASHLKAQHLGVKRSFVCPTCGSSFSQKHVYLAHAQTHLGIKPYICEICGNRFGCEKSLTQHKLLHSEEKKYVCPVCNKSFRQCSGLSIHMKSHKLTKDYVCFKCGKGFSQSQALVRHERIHAGEKPFECLLCNHRFTDSSVLRRHMIRIHKKSQDSWKADTKSYVSGRRKTVADVATDQDELGTLSDSNTVKPKKEQRYNIIGPTVSGVESSETVSKSLCTVTNANTLQPSTHGSLLVHPMKQQGISNFSNTGRQSVSMSPELLRNNLQVQDNKMSTFGSNSSIPWQPLQDSGLQQTGLQDGQSMASSIYSSHSHHTEEQVSNLQFSIHPLAQSQEYTRSLTHTGDNSSNPLARDVAISTLPFPHEQHSITVTQYEPLQHSFQ